MSENRCTYNTHTHTHTHLCQWEAAGYGGFGFGVYAVRLEPWKTSNSAPIQRSWKKKRKITEKGWKEMSPHVSGVRWLLSCSRRVIGAGEIHGEARGRRAGVQLSETTESFVRKQKQENRKRWFMVWNGKVLPSINNKHCLNHDGAEIIGKPFSSRKDGQFLKCMTTQQHAALRIMKLMWRDENSCNSTSLFTSCLE